MRRQMTLVAAALAAIGFVTNAFAQQLTVADANSRDELLFGTLNLSLADAIALGLEYNLDVEVERHAPLIAYETSEASWGAYDPSFNSEAGYAYERTVNTFLLNPVANPKQQVQDGSTGFSTVIPYLNADIGLDYVGSRVDTTSAIQGLNPQYDAGLQLTARVPVLRNLLWNASWTEVQSSSVRYSASNEAFRTSLMDVVQDIENNYWNLVARIDSVRVAQQSLDTATALLDQTKTEYEVGVKSKVDVYESEAGMAEREFELIRAENLAENAEDVLIDRILGTKLSAGSLLKIHPTDAPPGGIEYQIDPEQAAQQAFRRRPELAQARLAVEEREIALKFAKNQRLPQFDVLGAIGTGGTAGESRFSGTSAGNYADAHDAFFRDNGNADMSVRAQITIPLGNIRGRHDVSRSKLELRRTQVELTRLEQQIILEIRSAARNLESAQRGIVAAERRRIAAAEQLRAEEIRLEHGESTPFDVLLRQSDLVDAENQKINAQQLYSNSLTALHRAQGTILEVRAIHVADVEPLRPDDPYRP